MQYGQPARISLPSRGRVTAIIAVAALLGAFAGISATRLRGSEDSLAARSAAADAITVAAGSADRGATASPAAAGSVERSAAVPPAGSGSQDPGAAGPPAALPRTLGAADGAVPDDTSVFDDAVPGVTRLDPALRSALRRAAADASARDGIRFVVDSGWRSAAYQQHLLDDAVAKYGSLAEAARWVASPTTSEHVHGSAVDLGPSRAAAWLGAHGAAYGLCRVYANEPWHFELRAGASASGCPALYPDPTHDPRMQP